MTLAPWTTAAKGSGDGDPISQDRSDTTRVGMKAALELGRWTLLAPIGYLSAPRAMDKSLMADP